MKNDFKNSDTTNGVMRFMYLISNIRETQVDVDNELKTKQIRVDGMKGKRP